MIADKKLDPKTVTPSGFQGKILKHDVLDALLIPVAYQARNLFSSAEKKEKMSNLRQDDFAQACGSKKYHCHAHYFQ